MRALAVDDSKAIQLILKRILAGLGFEVVGAGDGQAALEKLQAGDDFDLALIDWNMPIMNGLELVQAIRADSTFDELRLIMVTTESELSRVSQAIEAGANEYIMKPFTPEMITEKLEILGLGCE